MERITIEQIMLNDGQDAHLHAMVYSSWPLTARGEVHPKHLGKLQVTKGARMTTLDDYLQDQGIGKADFIKLDVDGNECSVLRGSQKTLSSCHPKILMEITPYTLEEAGSSLAELVEILMRHGYKFTNLSGSRTLSADPKQLRTHIPSAGSINVIAISRS